MTDTPAPSTSVPLYQPDKQVNYFPTSSAPVFSDQARSTWAAMAHHVAKLRGYFGDDSVQAREAAYSFVRVAESLIGWGDVNVGRDGDLSLICSTRPQGASSFVFGIIFHGDRRWCQNMVGDKRCRAVINNDGTSWTYMRDDVTCGQDHTPSYPLDAPQPGTWSFHS